MTVNAMDLSQLGAVAEAQPFSVEEIRREEFVQVLKSALDGSAPMADGTPDNAFDGRTEVETEPVAGKGSSESRGSNVREERYDEAVVNGAVLAAIAMAATSARVEGGEAVASESGRLAEVEFERANAGAANRGRGYGEAEARDTMASVVGRGRLGAEQTAMVASAIETNSAREGVDPRALSGVEAISNAAGRGRIGEGVQEPVEVPRGNTDDSESRLQGLGAMRDEEQGHSEAGFRRNGEARRGMEQARFAREGEMDRGAEAARSEEASAALGKAVGASPVTVQAPEVVALEGAGLIANPVAGTAVETTTSTAPGAASSPAAAEAISVQTEWLARHGGGTARILLSPPSLGEVAIQVTLRGGNVDVVMVVSEAAAQSVAENQADRLAQAFSNHELRMETFEVRRGDPQDLANGDLGQFLESESREHDPAEEREAAHHKIDSTSMDENTDLEVDGMEELGQPKVISAGPEASVDLRI